MDTAPANVVLEVAKGLWRLLSEPISYIYNLADNLKLLEDERQRLMNTSADVRLKVEQEEVAVAHHCQRTKEVDGWLNEVQKLEVESSEVLQKGKSHQERKCLVWCCFISSYKLAKKVSQLRKDVEERQGRAKFDDLVIRLPPQVREMPMEKTIGLDPMLSQVWNRLQEEHVGIIGLYGMGGVGKTTLLKKINQKFCHTSHEFQIVLWIVVSKQVNLDKIREGIRNDLGIENSVWSNQSEDARAAKICRELNRKKFVLLIDDVWEALDLTKIGIPFPSPENGCKIVFTTRSEQVVLSLLCPLSREILEMVDDVYNLLRFSYDRLNLTHQQCFLYCALFPEDSNINKYRLIDLWIGEGFLGDTNNIYETRDRGELILGRLKSACLLESGRDDEHVKMHDVIRDMALWLARDEGKKDNKVIVEVYDEKIAKNISRWQEAERIYLIGPGGEINLTEESLVCSRLVTFLSHRLNLEISEQFFMSSQVLSVLEIDFMENIYLPTPEKFSIGIGGAINLRYLNLSYTRIEELPVEITKLTSLLYLLLEWTNRLRISKEIISSLLSLKVFRKTHTGTIKTEGFIEGVEYLKQLDELSLTIHDAFSVRKWFEAPNLRRSIRELVISDCLDLASIDANISRRLELTNLHHVHIFDGNPVNLSWLIYAPNLQKLEVICCDTLEVIFDESARLFSSLTNLYLSSLPKLRSIHKGTLSSPALTTITIVACPSLKKLPFDFNSAKKSFKEVRAECEWWSALEWDDEAAKAFFTAKFVPWSALEELARTIRSDVQPFRWS